MIDIVVGLGWIAISAPAFAAPASEAMAQDIPLYGLFQTEVVNNAVYDNPFADIELNAVFVSPSDRQIDFFGFYDCDDENG